MADGYTTMYDILKNSLVERRERYGTTAISHIVIDGNKFGGYKTFSSFWEKTYVKQPERSASGVIDNLNSYATFVTFHLKVDFAMMSIDDYRRLYNLMLDRSEFTVTAYNVLDNSQTHTCKMYFAPDQMPKLYAVARKLQGQGDKYIEVLGVQDYTIELIGTNASMDKVEIRYYDENDNLIENAVKSVDKGVETIVNYDYTPTSDCRFDGKWQKNDVEGAYVFNGSVITPTDNVKLKAVVEPTNQYTLSLDYGIGIKPTPQISSEQIDNFPVLYGKTIGETILSANIVLDDNKIFQFPSNGTGIPPVYYNEKEYSGDKAYKFSGWYWTPQENADTRVNSSTAYNYQLNRTIHQIYTPVEHSISFRTHTDNIAIKDMSVKYGEKVSLPILAVQGKNFKHWYYIDLVDGEAVQVVFNNNSAMPPFDLVLNAKWE